MKTFQEMGEPGDYPAWCLSSNRLYDLINAFENARRRAFLHLNARYDMPQWDERASRHTHLFYARLEGKCKECHNRHVRVSLTDYLLWQGSAPFLCFHRNVVQSVRMEADPERAKSRPEIMLPPECKQVAPETGSVTSGGVVTLSKIEKDL